MQAVILAGGRGARLGDITDGIPKPMVAIGGKPLLLHQIELLARYGITDIFLLVHYLKDQIETYFGDGSNFGVRIQYHEEEIPLGTAGGVREIAEMLTGDFLVLYGDVMLRMDLSRFIAYHMEKESLCTLVLHPNDHPADSDLVETDPSGRVVAFHPKPRDPETYYHNLVNAGAYIMDTEVLKSVEKGVKSDFGRDVFPRIYKNIRMFGYNTSEYLKDMGTPDRLAKVSRDHAEGLIRMKSYEHRQKAIFLDRDGVLNVEKNYISNPAQLELYPFVPDAIRKINQAGYLSVVVTNQPVVARNLCTMDDMNNIHKKLESHLGVQGAWLDAVYFCPHHPDKGFPGENPAYKIDCDCRKPKTGMFRMAMEHFNIAAEGSYMIGDSERDIVAGKTADCITIGVRTGHGMKDTSVMPDFLFGNLAEAVDFIVDDPYQDVFDAVLLRHEKSSGKGPFIILTGGNARSGKSTLAVYLKIRFMRQNIRTTVVELDNWLVPEDERTPDMNVYGRFRLHQVEDDLMRLLNVEDLSMPAYPVHPKRKSIPVSYSIRNTDVLIVEGVVALSSEKIRNLAGFKVYAELEEQDLKARINEYYAWRGKSQEDIARLYEKRKTDEYRLIEKERKFADLILKPESP